MSTKNLRQLLQYLVMDEPLAPRLLQAQERLGAGGEGGSLEGILEYALLCSLVGRRAEVEAALGCARTAALPEAGALLELGVGLVLLEAGYPLRAEAALERARGLTGLLSQPEPRAVCQVLHAHTLLQRGRVDDALRGAREVLATLPLEREQEPLALLALLAAAASLLALGDTAGVAACLQRMDSLPGRRGLLAARVEALHVRLDLTVGGVPPQVLGVRLEQVLTRLTRLGAARELGLTWLLRAEVAAAERTEAPAHWLAQAQPLLTQVGTPADVSRLRQAFHSFGRRQVDRLAGNRLLRLAEALQEGQGLLQEVLLTQRDAWHTRPGLRTPLPLAEQVDSSMAELSRMGEELVGHLERVLLERQQFQQLVVASGELCSLESPEALGEALARLVPTFISNVSTALLELGEGGALILLEGTLGAACASLERLGELAALALREGSPQVLPEPPGRLALPRPFSHTLSGRCMVVPLPRAGRPLVLAVARLNSGAPLDKRDWELLSLFGSLAGAALARASRAEGPPLAERPRPPAPADAPPSEAQVLPLQEVERRAFEHALRACQGNVAKAAKALGVAKATFYNRLRRYGLLEVVEPGAAYGPARQELRG